MWQYAIFIPYIKKTPLFEKLSNLSRVILLANIQEHQLTENHFRRRVEIHYKYTYIHTHIHISHTSENKHLLENTKIQTNYEALSLQFLLLQEANCQAVITDCTHNEIYYKFQV